MKIKRKSLLSTGRLVLIMFMLLSAVSFADANSDAFAQVFKEAEYNRQSSKCIILRNADSVSRSIFKIKSAMWRGIIIFHD
ncbi:hypothetical protein, partial [Leptotrichia sp. OH3620_COT-345]|uniref:hypothetical protein n=1 Tax=Leptotrichia sp. OH3620_COT-345 TaxID=2491048 RepID=UPI001F48C738